VPEPGVPVNVSPTRARHCASTQVPAGHPCLAGHFPGNPLVPAVVLLERVLEALHAWRGPRWRLQRIVAAKFVSALRPDERFDIELTMDGTRLDFRCHCDDRLLAHGSWEMAQ